MIKVQKLVPEIYYSQSRDFQFLGRVFEVLANYVKMNIDLVAENPLSKNSDDKMINLLTTTLGFETKHDYNTQDLRAICNVFVDLVRRKGAKSSIEDACRTLMSVQNLSGYLSVEDEEEEDSITHEHAKTYTINIYIPAELTDLILLEDLFDYILPAGYEYRFIRSLKTPEILNTFKTTSTTNNYNLRTSELSNITIPNDRDSRPDMTDSSETTEFSTFYTGKLFNPNGEAPR